MDATVTLETLKQKIKKFMDERDWQQFHTPKNLAIDISIEAAELLEIFTWVPDHEMKDEVQKKQQKIQEECADIVIALLNFANQTSLDISKIVDDKLKLIAQKYPVEKVKGKRLKYNEY